MHETILIKKKICLLGSFAVGKTSLIRRFVHDCFDEKYLTTLGVKISQKRLRPFQEPHSSAPVRYDLLVWDIAGMEKFDPVVMNYFRGAAGALAVADLTRPETVEALKTILEKFLSVSPDARLLVLGNKADIFQEDQETLRALKRTAKAFSAGHLLTSAKTGQGVEAAFYRVAGQPERKAKR